MQRHVRRGDKPLMALAYADWMAILTGALGMVGSNPRARIGDVRCAGFPTQSSNGGDQGDEPKSLIGFDRCHATSTSFVRAGNAAGTRGRRRVFSADSAARRTRRAAAHTRTGRAARTACGLPG